MPKPEIALRFLVLTQTRFDFEMFVRTRNENFTAFVKPLGRSYIFTFNDENRTRLDPINLDNEAFVHPHPGSVFINYDKAQRSAI